MPTSFFGPVFASRHSLLYTFVREELPSRGMRFFTVLPVLSLLLGARAHSLDSRDPVPHRLDVRDTLDVCGSLNTELVVPDILGILTAVGVIGESTISIHVPSVPAILSYRQTSASVCRTFPFSLRPTSSQSWPPRSLEQQ